MILDKILVRFSTWELQSTHVKSGLYPVSVTNGVFFSFFSFFFFFFFLFQEYPFILDPFQKEALKCLENKQSVLVSAHTSAGKTVVAEWVYIYTILCAHELKRLSQY